MAIGSIVRQFPWLRISPTVKPDMAGDALDSIVARHPVKFALAWLGLFCLTVLLTITLLDIGGGHPIIDEIKAQVQHRLIDPVVGAVKYSVLNFEIWPILLAVFLLQFALPARSEENVWSCSLFVDVLYFIIGAVHYAIVVGYYVAALSAAHQSFLGGFTLFRPDELPMWAQAVVAFLLYDFLRYVQHVLKHKVPFLWCFHAIHHSQPQLTLFTTYRTHVMDLVVQLTVTTIPFLILGFTMPYIVGVSLFVIFYEQLYHANLKLNLGLLHYIFITPQSHRIHHSPAAEHTDKNFGVLLSIWDGLFGTRVWDTKIYPTTGVPDPDFPVERPSSPLVALAFPIVQNLYPFEVLWKRYIRRAEPARLTGSAAE